MSPLTKRPFIAMLWWHTAEPWWRVPWALAACIQRDACSPLSIAQVLGSGLYDLQMCCWRRSHLHAARSVSHFFFFFRPYCEFLKVSIEIFDSTAMVLH